MKLLLISLLSFIYLANAQKPHDSSKSITHKKALVLVKLINSEAYEKAEEEVDKESVFWLKMMQKLPKESRFIGKYIDAEIDEKNNTVKHIFSYGKGSHHQIWLTYNLNKPLKAKVTILGW